jgi:hypothetical protein
VLIGLQNAGVEFFYSFCLSAMELVIPMLRPYSDFENFTQHIIMLKGPAYVFHKGNYEI